MWAHRRRGSAATRRLSHVKAAGDLRGEQGSEPIEEAFDMAALATAACRVSHPGAAG